MEISSHGVLPLVNIGIEFLLKLRPNDTHSDDYLVKKRRLQDRQGLDLERGGY